MLSVNGARLTTAGLFLLGCLPAVWLLGAAFTGQLGANPTEALIRQLGEWGLRFLLLTLAATPVNRFFKWRLLLRHRRMIGLFAFFYAVLHFCAFIWFDHFFDWGELLKDILKRPFITLGMAAWLLLLPLAITSGRWAVRHMGYRHWVNLHRLIYPAAVLVIVHFFMLVKADLREPIIYAALLFLLLVTRLYRPGAKARQRRVSG
jgi:sulfoxide reductase heme-binding subunit YedZ